MIKSFEEILIENNFLSREDAEKARGQYKDDKSVAETFLKHGVISEEKYLQALSIQLDLPYAERIDANIVDADIVSRIPFHFLKKHKIFPIREEGNSLKVAVRDPLNSEPLNDLAVLLGRPIQPIITTEKEIQAAINRFYKQEVDSAEKLIDELNEGDLNVLAKEMEEPEDILDVDHDAPIIKLLNLVIYQAIKDRASDIHIEPFEKEIKIRFRIDGILYNILNPPKRHQASIASRVKVMASLDIAEKRLPQDGRIKIKLTDREVDIRVSIVPTSHGERIVLRLLDKSMGFLNLAEIGLGEDILEQYLSLIHRSNGIILVTGPTGSGKTTTLYATLSRINIPDKNIITVEDPVEYQLDGIGQIQVNPKIELTFANGLRSILRQDPDVIMVGEIRDVDTAEIAIQSSLTGHLVFSTLHTNDSPGAIARLLDMGIEPFLVASSVIAIIAQRLVRVICKECRESFTPDEASLKKVGLTSHDLSSNGNFLYRGKGCVYCLNTGYRGRTGIYELLLIDDTIRRLVLTNTDAGTIKKVAVKNGMRTLLMDGGKKLMHGITTMEEILRVTQE